jgi:histidinol phosphatase-like enzyme (inositol monophosphatase family)
MPNNINLDQFKSFIQELAIASAAIIKSYFRQPLVVDTKKDNSPVTNADREAEKYLRKQVIKKYPDHGIIGEEFGDVNPNAEYTWVLDPIDGTKSFISGAVTFGTLIGLLHRKKPLLGAINFPALDEFLIGDGERTWLNGTTVKVRRCDKLQDAILITTDAVELYHICPGIFENTRFYRGLGDCYGYYLLATGFVDIMIDPEMSPWDLLPLIPIIRGAGGMISGLRGEQPESAQSAVATAPEIHQSVIEILSMS